MPRVFAVGGSPLPMPPRHDARGRHGKPCRRRLVAGHTRQTRMKRVTVDGMQLNVNRGYVLAWMTCLTICWSGLYAPRLTATKLRDGRARGGFNVATYTYIYTLGDLDLHCCINSRVYSTCRGPMDTTIYCLVWRLQRLMLKNGRDDGHGMAPLRSKI